MPGKKVGSSIDSPGLRFNPNVKLDPSQIIDLRPHAIRKWNKDMQRREKVLRKKMDEILRDTRG